MQPRILIVDDHTEYHEVLIDMFGSEHSVVGAKTLAEAKRALAQGRFDLILLDVHLPDGDGFSFFASLKAKEGPALPPVIFLTGQGDAPQEVMGFSLGADDYIVKPTDLPRLKARVGARLRRVKEQRERELTLTKGNLRLSVSQQRATLIGDGKKETAIELTPVEFKLLFHLLRHEDQVFSREQLLSAVWGNTTEVYDRTVDMHVSNVRKKISGSHFVIKAVHGVGYRLVKG